MILKVCGLKYQDNIDQLAKIAPDWIGLIFFPKSPRFVDHILELDRMPAKRIGVFVNADEEFIRGKIEKYALHGLQFHGNESPETCRKYLQQGYLVIKTFHVDEATDFEKTNPYDGTC
ncbi:MAG: phosphoribosylanthranilate isomerase, partial [Saprospiraceae bacterium]|nr:phosphoribosylanthranilate isomerase [Saprospiraceae bacterium]